MLKYCLCRASCSRQVDQFGCEIDRKWPRGRERDGVHPLAVDGFDHCRPRRPRRRNHQRFRFPANHDRLAARWKPGHSERLPLHHFPLFDGGAASNANGAQLEPQIDASRTHPRNFERLLRSRLKRALPKPAIFKSETIQILPPFPFRCN